MKFRITSLLFLLICASSLISQAPSVDEIIDTYYENIGGKDAWRAIKSMKISGDGMQMGMSFPLTVIAKEPNLQKVEVDISGQQIVDAFDGEVAWAVNPFAGGTTPTKKSELESAEAAKESFQDALLDYKEKGHTVTMEGEDEYEGSAVYKLKLVQANGLERLYFFDQDYGSDSYTIICKRGRDERTKFGHRSWRLPRSGWRNGTF